MVGGLMLPWDRAVGWAPTREPPCSDTGRQLLSERWRRGSRGENQPIGENPLVDRTVARFGRLDAAVNCAGTEGTPGPLTIQAPDTYAARDARPGKRQYRERVVHLRTYWCCWCVDILREQACGRRTDQVGRTRSRLFRGTRQRSGPGSYRDWDAKPLHWY